MNKSLVERVIEEYDANFDVAHGMPRVTWAEHNLACLVLELTREVDELKRKLKELENGDGGGWNY